LEVLAAITNQNDARVLNYTGYSNRKACRTEVALPTIKRHLPSMQNVVLAREWLGDVEEAAGRIDLAEIQLDEIKLRASTDSEEYKDLKRAITTGV
jgi:hypothetical protein